MQHLITVFLCIAATILYSSPASHAQELTMSSSQQAQAMDAKTLSCGSQDKDCLLDLLASETENISEQNWRDQTYRELAKLLTHEKQFDKARALIEKIVSNDTKAMTIRGIGMAAAELDIPKNQRDELFTKLRAEAEKIDHPPSYGIALTYISMAQAFAGDNEEAMKTAADLENEALRNKAYGEAAEIQASRGEIEAVLTSLSAVQSAAYRDKSCRLISKIFADNGDYDNAMRVQAHIENSYQSAQALLYILGKLITPEEIVTP